MGSQSEDDTMGDEVYQPEGLDDREDEGILDAEDTLEDRGADPYDEGWSPPERPLGVEHQGTTEREQREGETLDERLAEERLDPALEEPDADDDGVGDLEGGDGEPLDDEVGTDRAAASCRTTETPWRTPRTTCSPRTSGSTAPRPPRRRRPSIWSRTTFPRTRRTRTSVRLSATRSADCVRDRRRS